jgi:ATP-dependent DNA helicase DinG
MLCKNPDCGIYRLTYDLEYDAEKDPNRMPCTFCGSLLTKTGADILEGGLGGLVKEKRPAQIEYVTTIDQQYAQKQSITFIEGGTGVGKSFAYLVPTLLELLRDRKARALVVTSNKALQAQLINDFPRILEALGANDESVISYALLKGRNNYACPKLASQVPAAFQDDFYKFLESRDGRPADKDDWPAEIESWWWGKISSDNCPSPGECKINCNNRNARLARVIVTNYSYFGIFTKIPYILQQRNDLHTFKFLIMDEAHKASDAIRDTLRSTISANYVESIVGDLQNPYLSSLLEDLDVQLPENIYYELKSVSENIIARLDAAAAVPQPTYKQKSVPSTKVAHTRSFQAITIPNIREYLTDINITPLFISKIEQTKELLVKVPHTEDLVNKNLEAYVLKAKICNKLDRLTTFFSNAYADNFDLTNIAIIDPKGLSVIPIDVGSVIRPTLNDTFKHVVITSATLAHSGNDFSNIRESLGYNKPDDVVVEKVVGTPFDLKRAVRLYIPKLTSIPAGEHLSSGQWHTDVAEEIITLAKENEGNGFVLFSSATDLQALTNLTKPVLENAGIPVIVQTPGSVPATLQREYLRTPNSMLYGLRSFWEGVDIRGKKLSLVIIPKLPFTVPTDPVYKARCTRLGKDSFGKIAVPSMLEELRQGVGRLIRSQTDMGLVAILDSRFWSGTSNTQNHLSQLRLIKPNPNPAPKGYGKQINHSLGLIRVDSRDSACNILRRTKELYNKLESAESA